ncbi:hypothetical protein [Salinirubrum litoreum]|uniref:Rubrerythrin-like domain-containing protein n=1 Tax=Salinirubrum litoreum TaxID=1126234 RepID=A0ABD5RBA0_9EURY|nr:hypothetical protein [Salinirubrum litoreum]
MRRSLREWLADRFGSETPANHSTAVAGAGAETNESARLYTCPGCEKTLVARRLDSCPACGGAVERTQTGQDLGHVPAAD